MFQLLPAAICLLPSAYCLLPTILRQRLARNLAVVEVSPLGADDLVVLVPLARDDDDVAPARLGDGAADGLAAVVDLKVRPPRRAQALLHVAQDGLRVFGAGV